MIEPEIEPGLVWAVTIAAAMWRRYRACPTCRADAGKACTAMNGAVAGGQPDGVRTALPVAHAARKRSTRRTR